MCLLQSVCPQAHSLPLSPSPPPTLPPGLVPEAPGLSQAPLLGSFSWGSASGSGSRRLRGRREETHRFFPLELLHSARAPAPFRQTPRGPWRHDHLLFPLPPVHTGDSLTLLTFESPRHPLCGFAALPALTGVTHSLHLIPSVENK